MESAIMTHRSCSLVGLQWEEAGTSLPVYSLSSGGTGCAAAWQGPPEFALLM